jgi:hypothetical protein
MNVVKCAHDPFSTDHPISKWNTCNIRVWIQLLTRRVHLNAGKQRRTVRYETLQPLLLYLPCLLQFRHVIRFMLAGHLAYSETSLNFCSRLSHRWLWRVLSGIRHRVVRQSSQSFRRSVPHPSSGSEMCYASNEQERSNKPNQLDKICSSEMSVNYDPSIQRHTPEDSRLPYVWCLLNAAN